MLQNGSFEDGWLDIPAGATLNQEPIGWRITWLQPGQPLRHCEDLPGDTEATARTVPECVHKLADQLPPHEQPGGSDPLILDGETVYKVFAAYGSFSARLSQVLRVEPGALVTVTVPVRVHQHGNGDYGAAYWHVELGASASSWLTFKRDFDDRVWTTVSITARALDDGTLPLVITFESHTIAGIDFFIDNVTATVQKPEPQCRGLPREQYARVYNVVPQDVTLERFLEIARIAWERGHQTVGGSYDDAGVGDLDDRTAVLWDIPQSERQTYIDWYAEHYPGVRVVFEGESNGSVEPPAELFYSDNGIGLHVIFGKEGWLEYLQRGRPRLVKVFSAGDAYRAKLANPQCRVIWRHYVPNDGEWINGAHGPIPDAAAKFMGLYLAEARAAAQAFGISEADLWAHIDVIESINEVIGTFDPETPRAVEFDVTFAELVNDRLDATRAGILTIPVGNPHESEVEKLLPAAEIASKQGHYLAPHAYWTANPSHCWLEDKWQWHAGRFTQWDEVFVEHKFYPRYYFGEIGAVYSVTGDDMSSGRGWRSCYGGDFDRYIERLARYNELLADWNATHGNRALGGTVFTYSGWGWDDFTWTPEQQERLTRWAEGL